MLTCKHLGRSDFIIFGSAGFLESVPEIEVTEIASPNSGAQIHGFLTFLKIVEEEHIESQDASDGDEVPD